MRNEADERNNRSSRVSGIGCFRLAHSRDIICKVLCFVRLLAMVCLLMCEVCVICMDGSVPECSCADNVSWMGRRQGGRSSSVSASGDIVVHGEQHGAIVMQLDNI